MSCGRRAADAEYRAQLADDVAGRAETHLREVLEQLKALEARGRGSADVPASGLMRSVEVGCPPVCYSGSQESLSWPPVCVCVCVCVCV